MKLLLKIIGGLILVLLIIILTFSSIYIYKYYPRKIDSFEVNEQNLPNKILIASQGSDFKNALLTNLVESIKNDSTYIKVIHTSDLDRAELEYWRSIIIINTCVADKLQKSVTNFINKVPNEYPLHMVITAGDGRWMPADLHVDAISTASKLNKIDEIVIHIKKQIL